MSHAHGPILVVSGPSGAGKTTVGRLVAAAFDLSAHIQADHFTPFVVNGWVEPWVPPSEHHNHVLGGAVGAAALEFAVGGYTVVLDGHMFPEGIDGLTHWSARRGVQLHCAVLRPDLATCLARSGQRRPGDPDDLGSFIREHARFADLGDREANVIQATGTPEEVAAAVLAAFSSGHLRVAVPARPRRAGPDGQAPTGRPPPGRPPPGRPPPVIGRHRRPTEDPRVVIARRPAAWIGRSSRCR